MMGKVFAAGLAVLLLIGGVIGGLYYMENYDKIYYTQVDNSQITELSGSSDMKYEYDLSSYDESGKKINLKFKTSRELKENAYLLLEVRLAGVYKWEEVQYDELPQAVQEKLK